MCRKIYAGNPFVEAVEIGYTHRRRHGCGRHRRRCRVRAGDLPLREPPIGHRLPLRLSPRRASAAQRQDAARDDRGDRSRATEAWPRLLQHPVVVGCHLPESPTDILQWFNRFAPSRYEVVGMVEMSSGRRAVRLLLECRRARARGARPNSVWLLRRAVGPKFRLSREPRRAAGAGS